MISKNFLTSALLMSAASLTSAVPIALVGRADGALSCYPVGMDEIRRLPGWRKIEQFAKDNWGEGGVNVVANPEDFPDRPANACMKEYRVPTKFDTKPQCSTSSSLVEGKVDGTNQNVEFSEEVGTEESAQWTVTRSSSLTTGAKFSISVGIEGIGDASAETWMEATITDERSKSFTTTSKNTRVTKLSFEQKSGQTCKVKLETKKCSATYKGKAPVMISGFVWFNYEDKRAPKINPNNDGEHYKYSAHIDSILSPEERTMYIEFQGPANIQTRTLYDTDCGTGSKSKSKAKGQKDDDKKKANELKAQPGKKGVKKPGAGKEGGKKAPTKAEAMKPKKGGKKPATTKGKPPAAGKGKPGKKPAVKKPAAKKPAAKKPASKKPATKKPAAKKPAAKKPAAKKPAAKKPAGKKPAPKKPAAKKPAAKKPAAKKPAAPKKPARPSTGAVPPPGAAPPKP